MEKIKYFSKRDKKVLDKITEAAEKVGFNINIEPNDDVDKVYYLTFSTCTNWGRDFSFEITIYSDITIKDIYDLIWEYYEDFDVSYEAYLWLDENGHGKNGAPYDMLDVYNDTQSCENLIEALAAAIDKIS